MEYDPNKFYEWEGQIITGHDLNRTREWIEEYCERIERSLAVMGYPRKITGGRKYLDGQIRVDLESGLGLAVGFVQDTLNAAMFKHGKQCTISGKSIFITSMSSQQRIAKIIHGMQWIEAK